MTMPGRQYNATNSYRYGFNEKEKDDEIYGEGNAYDFENRIYDPRLVHWLSIDKLQAKRPGESPYLYTGGNPIYFIDPNGQDRIKYYVVIDETTGNTLVSTEKILNTKDMMSVHNISYPHSGIVETWDWYDVNEVHYTVKGKDGITRSYVKEERGTKRNTTSDGLIFKGDNLWWANQVGKNTKPEKEGEVETGISFTSSEGSREGSQYNKTAKRIDGIINIDILMQAIDGLKGTGDLTNEKAENLLIGVLESFSKSLSGATTVKNAWDNAVKKVENKIVDDTKLAKPGEIDYCRLCNENYDPTTLKKSNLKATDTSDTHVLKEKNINEKKSLLSD